jgi:hypothetical protein
MPPASGRLQVHISGSRDPNPVDISCRETWTFTFRVFEIRAQRRIFGPKTQVQKILRGFRCILASIIFLPRPYCCHDPIVVMIPVLPWSYCCHDPNVATILLLSWSQCCRDPIVVMIPVFPRSYCCHDPNVATILLLSWSQCCHYPIVMTIPMLLRSHCCHDPSVVAISVLSRSHCCQDPSVVAIPLLSRSHCCQDPSVVAISVLSRSHCCQDPTVVKIPVLSRSHCCQDLYYWSRNPATASEDKLRRLSACRCENSSAWISDSAIINCSYDLQEFNKSNYQSDPRVYSPTRDSILETISFSAF